MKALPLAALALALFGCRKSTPDAPMPSPPPPEPSATPVAAAPETPRCGRREPAHPRPAPLATSGAGGPVALARTHSTTIAYIVDEDTRLLHTVDVDAQRELASTPLAGKPGPLLLTADGRVVVALRDQNALEVFEPAEDVRAPLERLCRVETPAEPVGLAATPDGSTLLVTSRWGHALTGFAMADLSRKLSVDLPRDPYAVVTSADGRKAFVSHVAGARMSVVDLGIAEAKARVVDVGRVDFMEHTDHFPPMPMAPDGKAFSSRKSVERHARVGSQAFALARTASGRILLPEVLVETGPAGGRAGGYGDSLSAPTVLGDVSVVDEAGESVAVAPLQRGFGPSDCLLPRAAAIDEASGRVLVTCLGIDTVIAYQAGEKHPHSHERRRWKVAAGPTGIAVDTEARRALVWSQFDGVLSVVALDDPKGAPRKADAADRIPIARPPAPDLSVDLGRRLFHSAGGRRIAADGRACASCHPDGRDDALTWSSPDGPRQTPILLGRLEDTAPYGWTGEKSDLSGHFKRTIERLSGMGIRPEERDAIFAYLRSLPSPAPSADAAGAGDPQVARGATLFHAEATGCSSCHLDDDALTDHASHDVVSRTLFDVTPKFDTPSLRFIGRSAPYFHDGRYPTLLALLKGVDGTMGHTGHLSEAELRDLSAYLETL
jgi:hypothetical protein